MCARLTDERAGCYEVPAGVTEVIVTATGATGEAHAFGRRGGDGARVTAVLPVTPGDRLYAEVGIGGRGGAGSFGEPPARVGRPVRPALRSW